MSDVVYKDGFYQVHDDISKGDTIYLHAISNKNDSEEYEIKGEIVSVNHHTARRNNIVLLKIKYDNGTVNICSNGSVTRFAPGDDLKEGSPTENPNDWGYFKELQLIDD